MSTHKCAHCDYTTSRVFNLQRHEKSLHKPAANVNQPAQNVNQPAQNVNRHSCERCGKEFSRNTHLIRHLGSCKGVKDSMECPHCHKLFNTRTMKCKHLKKCTHDAPIINNIDNSTHIDNSLTINQIFINDFGKENTGYIDADTIKKCMHIGASGVKQVMALIYFNDDHPENHNVRLTSLKHAVAEVQKNNKWIPVGLDDTIENMITSSSTKLASGITQVVTEPTEESIKIIQDIHGMKTKSKKRIKSFALGSLVARRKDNKDNKDNEEEN